MFSAQSPAYIERLKASPWEPDPKSVRWYDTSHDGSVNLWGNLRSKKGVRSDLRVNLKFRYPPRDATYYYLHCSCGVRSCPHPLVLMWYACHADDRGRPLVVDLVVRSVLEVAPPPAAANSPIDAVSGADEDAQPEGLMLGGILKAQGHLQVTPVLLEDVEGRQRTRRRYDISMAFDSRWNLPAELMSDFVMLRMRRDGHVDALDLRIRPQFLIDAPYQERVLESLLDRGTLYWERLSSRPVSRAPDVKLKLDWKPDSEGNQTLALIYPHEAAQWIEFRAHSSWYYDPRTNAMGKVSAPGFDLRKRDRLDTVIVPAESAAEVSASWMNKPEVSHLPAPVSSPTPRTVKLKRKVRITVPTPAEVDVSVSPELRIAHEIDGQPTDLTGGIRGREIILRRGDEFLRVVDEEQEDEALYQKLIDAGLQPNGRDKLGLVSPKQGPGALADLHNAAALLARRGEDVDAAELPEIPALDDAAFPAVHLDAADDEGRDFTLDVKVTIGGTTHSLTGILAAIIADPKFSLAPPKDEPADASWALEIEGNLVRLPVARLRDLLRPIAEWMTVLEARTPSSGIRLGRLQAAVLAHETGLRTTQLPDLRKALANLVGLDRLPPPEEPAGFAGTLRPYQRQGLAWLNALASGGLGGVPADDMGLGRTVQILAHIQHEKNRGNLKHPTLIVAPNSLLFNWRNEAARFTPQLRTLIFHGLDRHALIDRFSQTDLIITTYSSLARDIEVMEQVDFSLAIFDESSNVQNQKTLSARACRRIKASRGISVNGTPLQNHLGELWAQVDLVLPGLLGVNAHFNRAYQNPIARKGDTERRDYLSKRLRPFLLRRTKDQVASELPPKTVTNMTVQLDGQQRALYETIRAAQHERVRQAIAAHGLKSSSIIVLDALLKMRQVCCDPRLVKLASAKKVADSAKLNALMDLIHPMIEEGRRILIFSSFTEMLDLISQRLATDSIDHLVLTGQTRNREDIVRAFQAGEAPIFLVSLKAGGVGLNLTAADTVVLYDPWWNPAAEDQAIDRAHRIGQDKPVMVYRLICESSIEDTIREMSERKAQLAQAILEQSDSTSMTLTESDIEGLFAPLKDI